MFKWKWYSFNQRLNLFYNDFYKIISNKEELSIDRIKKLLDLYEIKHIEEDGLFLDNHGNAIVSVMENPHNRIYIKLQELEDRIEKLEDK